MTDPSHRRDECHLLLEESSGTVIVDGVRAELPPREFKLLSELARRPGEPVAAADLVAAIWPDVTWDVSQELYVLISRLRKLIGDDGARLLKNRRGFGYYLALPEHEVVVAKTLEAVKARRLVAGERIGTAAGPSADHSGAPITPEATAPPARSRPDLHPLLRRPRRGAARVAVAAAVAFGLVLGSAAAGMMLAQPRTGVEIAHEPGDVAEPLGTDPVQYDTRAPRTKKNASLSRTRNKQRRTRRSTQTGGRTTTVTRFVAYSAGTGSRFAPATARDPAPTTDSGAAPGSPAGGDTSRRERKQLPAAPTAYLYHMVDDEGRHFMTTNPGLATDYQGKGYSGGPIGRVYTSPQSFTTRIATDLENAYIFSSIETRTEPASQLTTLWYATNGRGDFFYTTRQAEAHQAGWSGQHVGYIRTA